MTYSQDAIGLVKTMQDGVNTCGGQIGDVLMGDRIESDYSFSKWHRTLQQNAMREIVLPILRSLNHQYEEGRYDARNEASCRMAYKILHELGDEQGLPYI